MSEKEEEEQKNKKTTVELEEEERKTTTKKQYGQNMAVGIIALPSLTWIKNTRVISIYLSLQIFF